MNNKESKRKAIVLNTEQDTRNLKTFSNKLQKLEIKNKKKTKYRMKFLTFTIILVKQQKVKEKATTPINSKNH